MRAKHPLAVAFMAHARVWCAGNGVALGAAGDDEFGLVVVVRHLPRDAFTEAWRRERNQHTAPLFRELGHSLWSTIHTMGQRAVAPGQLVAVMLDPAALDHWRSEARRVDALARAA